MWKNRRLLPPSGGGAYAHAREDSTDMNVDAGGASGSATSNVTAVARPPRGTAQAGGASGSSGYDDDANTSRALSGTEHRVVTYADYDDADAGRAQGLTKALSIASQRPVQRLNRKARRQNRREQRPSTIYYPKWRQP